jgi:5-methylcytosine-specific restriction endonuclease McrA
MGLPCWLCGHEIDYDAEPGTPWSFSVDHAMPLKAGGDPLDWENFRAAHLRCNQRKGDRLHRPGQARR